MIFGLQHAIKTTKYSLEIKRSMTVRLENMFFLYATSFYNVVRWSGNWMEERCYTHLKCKHIKAVINHALQAVTTAKWNNNRDFIFFSSSLRTKTFLPYVCLNLLYSSSVNDFFFFLFSPSLKVTREMTLTDIFAFALVTAKQLRDVVW